MVFHFSAGEGVQGARRAGQRQGLGHSHHAEQEADAAAAGRWAGDLSAAGKDLSTGQSKAGVWLWLQL